MTKEKQQKIESFIEDYNTLLEELNEELEPLGISNKLITKLDQVEIENLNCDPDLWHKYHDIKS
jgi:flagellar capping protein FliD